MEVLFRLRFKIVVINVAWDFFFISFIDLATFCLWSLLCCFYYFVALHWFATSRIGATELCCCFFPLLLLCGAIASHCCCFVVVLQIRIGAITPCYYFALMLLLFPWLKWYLPLPCASRSLELIAPNFWQRSTWIFFLFYLRIFFISLFQKISLFFYLVSFIIIFVLFFVGFS